MLAIPAGSSDHDLYEPDVAVAPDGRVDVGFADQARDLVTGYASYYLASSTTDGHSFSTPLKLDSVPSNTQRGGFFPELHLAASDGSAYAAWTDSRRGDVTDTNEDVFFGSVSFLNPAPEGHAEPRSALPAFAGCSSLTANLIRGTAAGNSITDTVRGDRVYALGGDDRVDVSAATTASTSDPAPTAVAAVPGAT